MKKKKEKKVSKNKSFKKSTIQRKKVQHKLPKDLILECKRVLVSKYNELTNINYKNEDVLPDVGDDIDLATMALDKEIVQELTDTQRTLLDLIAHALEKIEKGGFGICESCGEVITQKRIKVLPWAKYCIKCQTNNEGKS